ncbi:MAG: recombinase family protein [Chloroflexi bacterium]|nr:recombinase family protein [Chloroflexota bacterium]
MKAVIYARTATTKQVQPDHNVKAQISKCRKYAKENGLEVVKEFADPGRSGATLNRPGLNKMRELVARDSIRAVVIADLARLSRSSADLSVLEREFGQRGVSIDCVTRGMFDSISKSMQARGTKKTKRTSR